MPVKAIFKDTSPGSPDEWSYYYHGHGTGLDLSEYVPVMDELHAGRLDALDPALAKLWRKHGPAAGDTLRVWVPGSDTKFKDIHSINGRLVICRDVVCSHCNDQGEL